MIMDTNDSFSELKKIPLGRNRTNGAVFSNINLKVEICFALYIFDNQPSHASFPVANTACIKNDKLNPNNDYS